MKHVKANLKYSGRRKSQEGAVLLMVLLLVILFTGLGLIAMRHTCAELRASGAYLDKTQAGMVGEAAISMLATDMRLYWDFKCSESISYMTQFRDKFPSGLASTATRPLKFSWVFDDGDTGCPTPEGQIPGLLPDTQLAETATLQSATASITLAQRRPVCAPCPAGYSGGDTYAWYWFTAESTATYGAPAPTGLEDPERDQIIRGRAVARSRMMIGPLMAFDYQCRCKE